MAGVCQEEEQPGCEGVAWRAVWTGWASWLGACAARRSSVLSCDSATRRAAVWPRLAAAGQGVVAVGRGRVCVGGARMGSSAWAR